MSQVSPAGCPYKVLCETTEFTSTLLGRRRFFFALRESKDVTGVPHNLAYKDRLRRLPLHNARGQLVSLMVVRHTDKKEVEQEVSSPSKPSTVDRSCYLPGDVRPVSSRHQILEVQIVSSVTLAPGPSRKVTKRDAQVIRSFLVTDTPNVMKVGGFKGPQKTSVQETRSPWIS